MDPNACLERFDSASEDLEAALDFNDPQAVETAQEEMKEAHADLVNWLTNGGFEPNWAKYGWSKESFLNYYEETDEDYIKN